MFVAVYIYEHTLSPSFSSFFSGLCVHAPTYGLFVRIYLFISCHPCSRLIVCRPQASLESVHFTTRHIVQPFICGSFDIYIILRNQYSYPHRVCTNTFPVSLNFLHTMLLFPLTSLPVVGYNLLLHRSCILPILAKST